MYTQNLARSVRQHLGCAAQALGCPARGAATTDVTFASWPPLPGGGAVGTATLHVVLDHGTGETAIASANTLARAIQAHSRDFASNDVEAGSPLSGLLTQPLPGGARVVALQLSLLPSYAANAQGGDGLGGMPAAVHEDDDWMTTAGHGGDHGDDSLLRRVIHMMRRCLVPARSLLTFPTGTCVS